MAATDLDAARARHRIIDTITTMDMASDVRACGESRCDFALAIAALDTAHGYNREMVMQMDAARALADQLGVALDAMPDADCGCETCDAANADKADALAKWEASRGD